MDFLSPPDGDLFDFNNLKLVEKADENTDKIPHDLKGCIGYLQEFPLRAPNVDQKKPETFADMVCILTNPDAEAMFDEERQRCLEANGTEVREEGAPSVIYNPKTSQVAKKLLSSSKKCHVRAPGVLGHLVLPGCLSFYHLDGRCYAAPPGRWFLTSFKAIWVKRNVPYDQPSIRASDKSNVLIVRVPPGGVGTILDQGSPILLDVGTHCFNSGTVQFRGIEMYSARQTISHDKFHYVRVERGFYAKVWAEVPGPNGNSTVVPRLLSEGKHFIDSHLFSFKGMVAIDTEYIHHGSLHLFSIRKGTVGKIFRDNFPRLLGEGDHSIESSQLTYYGNVVVADNPIIEHGTITICRITMGQIGLAWHNSEPLFIDRPGLYEYNSPDFKFVEFKSAEDQLVQLGAKKIVLVHTGSVGVTYDQGTLKVLDHGRHVIDSATHIFHRFLSTQQKSIRLASISATEKALRASSARSHRGTDSRNSRNSVTASSSTHMVIDPDSDLTICETKDLVKVGLRADVFYSIEDPAKCINKIDTDELEDLVRETAVATLTNIIRSTALNEIAQSKQVSAGGDAGGLMVLSPPSQGENEESTDKQSPMAEFFDKAHDAFLDKLHDDFIFRYGVDIANIRIESFKIMDQDLSDQISRHALTTAQIENEMANLSGNSLISTTREKTAAEVKDIAAQAKARELSITTNAENQRKIDIAKADAEALKIERRAKAEAEAEAILTKAKAEAEAIRVKADAEAKRAELLSSTDLGMQEALLGLYSEIVIQSNKGVEKVIYMDPSVNKESPFALGSLQNLNNDLHSLSQLGIAANQVATAPSRPPRNQR